MSSRLDDGTVKIIVDAFHAWMPTYKLKPENKLKSDKDALLEWAASVDVEMIPDYDAFYKVAFSLAYDHDYKTLPIPSERKFEEARAGVRAKGGSPHGR